MNLEDLRALLVVVEHGSIQAASKHLDVPRTQLRRRLDRLEKEVGTALLHREARGVRLTAAGEQLAQRAGPLLLDARNMLEQARAAEHAALGTVRLISPVGSPARVRVEALLRLRQLYPGVALDVVEADDPLTLLRQPFDVMLHFGPPPDRDGWFSRVIMRLPLRLYAASDYLEREGRPTRVEQLVDHQLLAWRVGQRFARTWPLRGGGELPISPVSISANAELLSLLAARGGGIALLPGASELFHPPGAQLEPVLEQEIGDELPLRVLSPHPSHADPRMRALLENLQRLLESMGAASG